MKKRMEKLLGWAACLAVALIYVVAALQAQDRPLPSEIEATRAEVGDTAAAVRAHADSVAGDSAQAAEARAKAYADSASGDSAQAAEARAKAYADSVSGDSAQAAEARAKAYADSTAGDSARVAAGDSSQAALAWAKAYADSAAGDSAAAALTAARADMRDSILAANADSVVSALARVDKAVIDTAVVDSTATRALNVTGQASVGNRLKIKGVDLDSTLKANLEDSLAFALDVWGSTNTVASDMSGQENHGALTGFDHDGTDGWTQDGSRRALKFDMDGDRIIGAVDIDSTQTLAVFLDAILSDTTAPRSLITLRENGRGETSAFSYRIVYSKATKSLQFQARNLAAGDLYSVSIVAGAAYNPFVNNRVGMQWTGAALVAYINGDSVGAAAKTGGTPYPVDSLVIGSYYIESSEQPLSGRLSGVSIYRGKTLSPAEIKADYARFRAQIQPGHPVAEAEKGTIDGIKYTDSLAVPGRVLKLGADSTTYWGIDEVDTAGTGGRLDSLEAASAEQDSIIAAKAQADSTFLDSLARAGGGGAGGITTLTIGPTGSGAELIADAGGNGDSVIQVAFNWLADSTRGNRSIGLLTDSLVVDDTIYITVTGFKLRAAGARIYINGAIYALFDSTVAGRDGWSVEGIDWRGDASALGVFSNGGPAVSGGGTDSVTWAGNKFTFGNASANIFDADTLDKNWLIDNNETFDSDQMLVRSRQSEVRGNRFYRMKDYGLFMSAHGNRAIGNRFINCDLGNIAHGMIHVYNFTPTNTISRNFTVAENEATLTDSVGAAFIYITGATYFQGGMVEGNSVTGAKLAYGIYSAESYISTFQNNRLSNCFTRAITARRDTQVVGNFISNAGIGIYLLYERSAAISNMIITATTGIEIASGNTKSGYSENAFSYVTTNVTDNGTTTIVGDSRDLD